MPIYEYRCDDCRRVTSIFVRSAGASVTERCEHCGSPRVARLISRVARLRTEGDVLDEYGSPGIDARPEDAYRDPRQIGRWLEKRFEEYGIDVPEETRAMIDSAREGELPSQVKDV